jgi:hypothetical protein
LSAPSLLLAALVSTAILFARLPDLLLHARLWGEDGWIWYPQAYTLGPACLLIPDGGYLNTLQRLVALAVQPLPLAWVPTVFAVIAFLVQIGVAVFLVSPRMALAVPSLPARVAFALIFLMLPGDVEILGNLTDAHWNLVLLAFAILVATPPAAWYGWVFDVTVLLISGLSGPFCLLLLPMVGMRLWRPGPGLTRRVILWRAVPVALTAMVQVVLVATTSGRANPPLGATPGLLARILSLQLVIPAETGLGVAREVYAAAWWAHAWPPILVCAAAALVFAVGLARSPRALRELGLFAALVLAGGLTHPLVSLTQPTWPLVAVPGVGNRYFVYAILTWVGVLLVLGSGPTRPLRLLGFALLVPMLLLGMPLDFRPPVGPPTDFLSVARAFSAAPPGTTMVFQVNPPGAPPMVLIKKAP